MQEKFCESCGAPMGELNEMYGPGTEADGTPSADYCKECYTNGAFVHPERTLQQMIEAVAATMVKDFGYTQEDAMEQCNQGLPTLKRWRTA